MFRETWKSCPTFQISKRLASAGLEENGTEEELDEEARVKQIEEAHLAESLERLILEAYKLLQAGEMSQAESLLQEGKCTVFSLCSDCIGPYMNCPYILNCPSSGV